MAALALADRHALGVAAAHGDDRLRHQRVVDDDVGLHQQRAGRAASAGPPRPDRRRPARHGRCRAASRGSSSARRGARLVGMADRHARAPARRRRSAPRSARRGCPLRQQLLDGVAKRVGKRAQARRATAAACASMRARIICASTGPAPSVPIATATGARLTSAGVKKSQRSGRSTALAGMPARARPSDDAAVERLVAGGGEDQHRALEMAGPIGRRDMIAPFVARSRQQAPARLLGDHDDAGARLAEQPRLGQRLLALADDDARFALRPA